MELELDADAHALLTHKGRREGSPDAAGRNQHQISKESDFVIMKKN